MKNMHPVLVACKDGCPVTRQWCNYKKGASFLRLWQQNMEKTDTICNIWYVFSTFLVHQTSYIKVWSHSSYTWWNKWPITNNVQVNILACRNDRPMYELILLGLPKCFRQDHNKLSHMGLANLRLIFPDSPGSGDESSSFFFLSPSPDNNSLIFAGLPLNVEVFVVFFWGGSVWKLKNP